MHTFVLVPVRVREYTLSVFQILDPLPFIRASPFGTTFGIWLDKSGDAATMPQIILSHVVESALLQLEHNRIATF